MVQFLSASNSMLPSRYAVSLVLVLLFRSSCCLAQGDTIFVEGFEEPSMQDVIARWSAVENAEGMHFSNDVPVGSTGRQSLVLTAVLGTNTGGYLYRHFPAGYDSLFARFFVKFPSGHHPVHHFIQMGGYNPPTRWPQGGAGTRPAGDERFTTGIEPMGDRWSWDFYTYWMHMRGNAQPGTYWGNSFDPVPPSPVRRDEWICVEFMVKLNDPITRWNGEQAFWIDGVRIHHLGEGFPRGYWSYDRFHPDQNGDPFEGFQWRNDPSLRVNFFWLLYYMTQGPLGQTDSVLFDDIVISTRRLGPVTASVDRSEKSAERPTFTLHPQPASGRVTLSVWLPEAMMVEIRLFDLLGRVRRILRGAGMLGKGYQFLDFDVSELPVPDGPHFVVVSTPERVLVKKLLVLPSVRTGTGGRR